MDGLINPTVMFEYRLDADYQPYFASVMLDKKYPTSAQFVNRLKTIVLNAVNTYRLQANKQPAYWADIKTRTMVWGNSDSTNAQFTLYVDARQPSDILHRFWLHDAGTNTVLCDNEVINHRAIKR